MTRGEVWWANLPDPWRRRPVLLLARNEAYDLLTWVVVAPLTTQLRAIPTHVRLEPETDGVPQTCAVTLDNLQTMRTEWLVTHIAQLSEARMQQVEEALHFALALSY
jgi:mRNA interferase MazF